MNTPIETQTEILAELWMDYRTEPYFTEFVEYADLGLPLAYSITSGIVKPTEQSNKFIEDTWSVFLGICGHAEDTGFEDLAEMLATLDIEE
jgi:hypothetical protein